MRQSAKIFLPVAMLVLLFATNCACEYETPIVEYMPDMADSPARESQEAELYYANHSAARLPPKGAIPQGYYPYEYLDVMVPEDLPNPEKGLVNPLKPSVETLRAGEAKFQTYCSPCHGVRGAGNGRVVGPYPRFSMQPPALISDKIKGWTDGQIYHIITKGRGLMKSYAYQIPTDDRWKVILYLRELQKYADNESKGAAGK